MKITKPKRARRGAKRIDLTEIRKALEDKRVWAALGVIVAPSDGSQHWRIEPDNNGNGIDILVEVVLQPSQVQITARLQAGMWVVPSLGDEVAVLVPDGRTDFMPIVTGLLSSNTVPTVQAPSPTTIVIACKPGGKVYIHDGSGGAGPLPTKADFDNHTHGPGTFVAGMTSVLGTSDKPAAATGTQVLEAK